MGIDIDKVSMDEALELICSAIEARSMLSIAVVNAAKLVNMKSDRNLYDDVSSSQLILADGMSVVWASRLLRSPLEERVSGIDLMYGMMECGNDHGYRFYLFGASETVSQKVAGRMKELYPNAVVAGRRNGYFEESDEAAIAKDIAESDSNILLVAITSPVKERFMAKWGEMLNVQVIHGVGGSFDVMSGKVVRAPMWMQKSGLEWFYRVLQEPRRLAWRYIRTNTLFIAYLVQSLFSRSTK